MVKVGELPHGSEGVGGRSILGLRRYTGSLTRFNRSQPSGLSYYLGAIMEIHVQDRAGSLGGGGRYDSLVGMFLGEDVPACGFRQLERILV
jgi:histidyl-tRNA synthetase